MDRNAGAGDEGNNLVNFTMSKESQPTNLIDVWKISKDLRYRY